MGKCFVCEVSNVDTKISSLVSSTGLRMCLDCDIKVSAVYVKMHGGPVKDKVLKAVLEVRSTLRNEGV